MPTPEEDQFRRKGLSGARRKNQKLNRRDEGKRCLHVRDADPAHTIQPEVYNSKAAREIGMSPFVRQRRTFGPENAEPSAIEDTGDALRFIANPFQRIGVLLLAIFYFIAAVAFWLPYQFGERSLHVSAIGAWLSFMYLLATILYCWNFALYYEVSISGTDLRVKRRSLGVGWTKIIPLEEISNPRFLPVNGSPDKFALAFDRHDRTRLLPIVVYDAEAKRLQGIFHSRFPQLARNRLVLSLQ
jgi:hypothetical protein